MVQAVGHSGELFGFYPLQQLNVVVDGSKRHDPLVMSGAAALLALVAIVAALVPARAAARVDPLLALRHE